MEAIKIVNYVIMVLFFACYAYQFLYIPIALLKKKNIKLFYKENITETKRVNY